AGPGARPPFRGSGGTPHGTRCRERRNAPDGVVDICMEVAGIEPAPAQRRSLSESRGADPAALVAIGSTGEADDTRSAHSGRPRLRALRSWMLPACGRARL